MFVEFEAGTDKCALELAHSMEAGSDAIGACSAVEREHGSTAEQVDAGSDNDNLLSVVHGKFASRGPARENGFAIGQGQFAERAGPRSQDADPEGRPWQD